VKRWVFKPVLNSPWVMVVEQHSKGCAVFATCWRYKNIWQWKSEWVAFYFSSLSDAVVLDVTITHSRCPRPGLSLVQSTFFAELLSCLLDSVITIQESLYVDGDFNIHRDCSDNLIPKQFVDALHHYGLGLSNFIDPQCLRYCWCCYYPRWSIWHSYKVRWMYRLIIIARCYA